MEGDDGDTHGSSLLLTVRHLLSPSSSLSSCLGPRILRSFVPTAWTEWNVVNDGRDEGGWDWVTEGKVHWLSIDQQRVLSCVTQSHPLHLLRRLVVSPLPTVGFPSLRRNRRWRMWGERNPWHDTPAQLLSVFLSLIPPSLSRAYRVARVALLSARRSDRRRDDDRQKESRARCHSRYAYDPPWGWRTNQWVRRAVGETGGHFVLHFCSSTSVIPRR